jgi:hypothetical protein
MEDSRSSEPLNGYQFYVIVLCTMASEPCLSYHRGGLYA